jgi:adenosine/AMP kinase
MASNNNKVDLELVEIDNPDGLNFVLGQAHFIKTVEDLAEIMASAGPSAKFGLAFNEASGDLDNKDFPGRRVRSDGNAPALVELAKRNAMALGAGHVFIVFMDGVFPVTVLSAIKAAPTVCRVFCATANPTAVVVATPAGGGDSERRGVVGVLDGLRPLAFEDAGDVEKRKSFLRMIGYKR